MGLVRAVLCTVAGCGLAWAATSSPSPSSQCPMENDAAIFLFIPNTNPVTVGGLLSDAACTFSPVCSSTPQVFAQLTNDAWPLPSYAPSKPVYARDDVYEGPDSEPRLIARAGWQGMFLSPYLQSLEGYIAPERGNQGFWTGFSALAAPVPGSARTTCSSTPAAFFDSNALNATGMMGSFFSTTDTWYAWSTVPCSATKNYLCIVRCALPSL